MSQSLARVLLHIVFSTKNRERWLDAHLRDALYGYMAVVGRDFGCEVFRIGGVDDHVHLAVDLGRTIAVSGFVKQVKQTSSAWLKEQSRIHAPFEWQRGYGAFSVGQSQLSKLVAYIDGQEEHHRKIGFQEEYRLLLKKYGVEGDERFLWD